MVNVRVKLRGRGISYVDMAGVATLCGGANCPGGTVECFSLSVLIGSP